MKPTAIAFFVVLFVGAAYLVYRMSTARKRKLKAAREAAFPDDWAAFLEAHVPFYSRLSAAQKLHFQEDVREFLAMVKITPISTQLDAHDKLLIAASAAIPVFGFPDWQYHFLKEVIVYPSHFNHQHQTGAEDANILGMVGDGYMEGVVILSLQALRHGFSNETDKRNTAVHEFVHILDKQDGIVDGIPGTLMDQAAVLPWVELIREKTAEINSNRSDIRPYAATNRQEFFAVVSEYFFERPELLRRKHPALYETLSEVFRQQPKG